jgi:hypothetical protein
MDPLDKALENKDLFAQKVASLMAGELIIHSLTMFETSLVVALVGKEIERLGLEPGMEILQRNLKLVKTKLTNNTVSSLENVLKSEHKKEEALRGNNLDE